MKTVKTLLNATTNKTLGNHSVKISAHGYRYFKYHDTTICYVDDGSTTKRLDPSST